MNKEITHKDLSSAQQRASKKAIQLNRALGLKYKIVRNGNLIEVYPDGTEKILRKAVFGTVAVTKNKFILNNE